MRITALMSIAAGTTVWAAPPAVTANRSLTVCLETGTDGLIRSTAAPIASRVFASIGVRINWGPDTDACRKNQGAITVHLSYATRSTRAPHAWASARPFGAAEIVVFYDRIQETMRTRHAPRLLSYVLVHEITHVLQGVDGHSGVGIMKAAWDDDDLFEMNWERLQFAPQDVSLIYLGLEGRAGRLIASKLSPAGLQ